MDQMKENIMWQIIVFTRYPVPGKTKTRLIKSLGATGSAQLQSQLSEQILHQVNLLQKTISVDVQVYYAHDSGKEVAQWLGSGNSYRQQCRGDIGRRMEAAFQQAFTDGAELAILIGTDIPDLTASLLHRALQALSSHDLVFGPTHDGGYYLIGMKKAIFSKVRDRLFYDIPWSTDSVLRRSTEKLESVNSDIYLLQQLRDLDTPAQLHAWLEEIPNDDTALSRQKVLRKLLTDILCENKRT